MRTFDRTMGRGGSYLAANTPKVARTQPFIRGPVRGVVTAVYVYDSAAPSKMGAEGQTGYNAIYVDVKLYGSIMATITRALVTVPRAGVQDGDIWRPKAATFDFTVQAGADENLGSDPESMDGDHCLVDFIEGDPYQPVVIGWIPHPRSDRGNDGDELGQRLRLVEGDGRPFLQKHRGVFWGVQDDGNMVIDLREAYAEENGPDFQQPPPNNPSSGNLTIKLPEGCTLSVEGNGGNTVNLKVENTNVGDGGEPLVKGTALNEYLTTKLSVQTPFGPSGPSAVPNPLIPGVELSDKNTTT